MPPTPFKPFDATRQDADLAAWRAWKAAPTDMNASALLKQVDPLIQKEVNKWSGALARPLLETEAKRLAMEAFRSYDPAKGAALGTHVVNQLQRISRLTYTHQNLARLPENKALLFNTYSTAHAELSDQHGRAPTADELADHLRWPLKKVEEYRKAVGRKERLESGGLFGTGDAGLYNEDVQSHALDFIHHDLPAQHKAIFEHLTGYGGAPILSNQEIKEKLNLTQGQYSYAKKQLIQKLEKANGK